MKHIAGTFLGFSVQPKPSCVGPRLAESSLTRRYEWNSTSSFLDSGIRPVLSSFIAWAAFQIGTGFTDEVLDKHHQFFKDHVISGAKPYYRYDDSHSPDHWFDAVQVRGG